jgi:hypothetical protein
VSPTKAIIYYVLVMLSNGPTGTAAGDGYPHAVSVQGIYHHMDACQAQADLLRSVSGGKVWTQCYAEFIRDPK